MATVDPITLSVVSGVLETTQREMTVTLEKTGRSSVFNLAHDYSHALFDKNAEMIIQGQDIPIHLGALIPAMKAVARFFGDDIHEGDIIYHNDPVEAGSHALDCCVYKPVFYRGELVFWTVSKGHVTDIGGPVPAGYNPDAKDLYAEGLRIPPVKIYDRGQRRYDVINFIMANVRARRDAEGDLNAQIGACQVGERNLLALLDKYGVAEVEACIGELMDMADRHMRSLIETIPDGTYSESAILEDAGHGFGDLEIKTTITVTGSDLHIAIESPPQIPYFINSYAGNSYSGIYLGLMMFAQVDPPYNEGLYRCVTVDLGPLGTLCNAREPAPTANCTTTPMETLTDSVRKALEQAVPDRVVASWGHANGLNIAGWDSRNDEEYVSMVLATIISGAGATDVMDGWHSRGPLCCFGALTSGDIELLEYSYPVMVHRYSLMTDSGGAGKFRGGSGTCWEVEPLTDPMTVITFGEGRVYPTPSANGAQSKLIERKVGRAEIYRPGQEMETRRVNFIETIQPGERIANMNPGGGGYGPAWERPVERVVTDVRDGLVSIEAAEVEYGVKLDPSTLAVDEAATAKLRQAMAA